MSIELGYGLVTCQLHPDRPETWAQLYAEALDLATAVEDAGLSSVWVSEHHFVDDGHLPSLLPLLSAFAARTSRVVVGTALLLAPLHDPVRLAEDAAVVDQVSGGRLVLGLGLGWRDEEFEVLGVPMRHRVGRLARFAKVAREAWAGDAVAVEGGAPRVTPLPARLGGPPLWIGALAEPAIRRAGRMGDGFMATEVTPDELATQVAWAREEHSAAERSGELSISLHLPTLCIPGGIGWADAADALRYPGWKYEDMAEDRGAVGPLRQPGAAEESELARLRETSLLGSPAEVAEQVRGYADAAGGSIHFIARSYLPGLGIEGRREALAGLAEVKRQLVP